MYDDVVRAFATLIVAGKQRSPDDVTRVLGLPSSYAHRVGDPIINPFGRQTGTRKSNVWHYSSEHSTQSKDLDDHLQALISVLSSRTPAIRALQSDSEVFINCTWESSRLFVGSGPTLLPSTCSGIGLLGVELTFDVYCSLEHEGP